MIEEGTPKTGEFRARVGLRPEAMDGEKSYKRGLLLNGMASQVAVATGDNQAYELVARVGKWEPADLPFVEKLQVDFTLVLLDPLTAEVGEWVKDLPHWVPDCKRTVILGEGHGEATGWLFRRGDLGWQRVE